MERLFTPIRIGSIALKNRFIMAMENGMAALGTGDITPRIIEFMNS